MAEEQKSFYLLKLHLPIEALLFNENRWQQFLRHHRSPEHLILAHLCTYKIRVGGELWSEFSNSLFGMNLCLSSRSSEKLIEQCLVFSDSAEDIIALSDIWLAVCPHQATAAATEVDIQSSMSCWPSFSYPIRNTCIKLTQSRLSGADILELQKGLEHFSS